MKSPSSVELATRIDAALWKPSATTVEIEAFCAEARQYKFRGVCVNGSRIELAYARLEDSGVKVIALVGFPLGAMHADVKRYETEAAIDHGAHEIEIVLNAGQFKDGGHKYVLRELRDVVEAADERPVCAVLEIALLTREEITLAGQLIPDSGAQTISTSADFSTEARVSVADVKLLRELVGPKLDVKGAGGIRDVQCALALLDAGATRIGTTCPTGLMA